MTDYNDPQVLVEYERVLSALGERAAENIIEPDLARMQHLMDLIGNPQHAYRVIHVAGTNGKTSTSRMIESLLREAGLNVGLTTSPHLHDVRERIRIHGEPISLPAFIETYDDIAPYLDLTDQQTGGRLSYFEVLTAMAFAAFADAPVDVAVIEVGMGGRWDSTNVVQPDVAVITPVGLDHQRYLGDTIEEIAAEKAGIIKPGCVAVVGPQERGALEVISERCVDVAASLLLAATDFGVVEREVAVGGSVVTLRGLGREYQQLVLPLHGEHQAQNASLALAAVEAFFGAGVDGRAINSEIVEAGFAQVTSPGRLEVVRRAPAVIIDAAHNSHGARSLVSALSGDFSFDRIVFVVGIFADKDVAEFLSVIEPMVDHFIATATDNPRALPAEELAEQAEACGIASVQPVPKLVDAITRAVEVCDEWANENLSAGVVICGSVYTVGQARALLGRHTA